MFKKSSGSKNKNAESNAPKGAILTPPENLYIPESHFVPESQYVPDQQQQPPYMSPDQQYRPDQQYMQDNAYMQGQGYMPPEASYMPQMPDPSSYIPSELGQMPQDQPQAMNNMNTMNPMNNMGPMNTMNPMGMESPSQAQPSKLENQSLSPVKFPSNVYPLDSANVKILFDGYSRFVDGDYFANCTCTLIKGGPHIVVDTMTVWDEEKLVSALHNEGLNPEDIDFVICTHGHSDHTGCNHLFKNAIHIVGFSISHKDQYYLHPDFRHGEEFNIDPATNAIKIVPTPGHTLQDVTVVVYTNIGVLAITGDLFEKAEDLDNEYEWLQAGSDNASLQRRNRQKILDQADYIIPGHGPIFKVPEKCKRSKNGISNISKPMTMNSSIGYS